MAQQIQKYLLVVVALTVIGLVLAGLVIGSATASWHAAIKAGNETATILNIKTIAVVEATYYYSRDRKFGTFQDLIQEKLLNTPKFSGNPVTTDGYVLKLNVTTDPASFSLSADPESRAAGTRHFYLDSISREIHVNPNQPAGPNDPVLDEKK